METELSKKYPIGSVWLTRAGKKVIVIDHGINSQTLMRGQDKSNEYGICTTYHTNTFFEQGKTNSEYDMIECIVPAKEIK